MLLGFVSSISDAPRALNNISYIHPRFTACLPVITTFVELSGMLIGPGNTEKDLKPRLVAQERPMKFIPIEFQPVACTNDRDMLLQGEKLVKLVVRFKILIIMCLLYIKDVWGYLKVVGVC